MHCIYLHGFASGPSSTKATYFADRIRSSGLTIEIPDLNVPTFESMTLSSQLDLVEQLVALHGKVLLIGSSMGGLVAAMVAGRNSNVAGLILLAPGFGLSRRWQSLWGEDALTRWQRDGHLEVFHHARKQQAKLSYQFVQDAAHHDSEKIRITCPTLILHGAHDTVVPISESIKFRTLNAEQVELHTLDDDHQMLNTLQELWDHSSSFLARLV